MPDRPEMGEVLSIPTFGLSQPGAGPAAAGGRIPLPVKVVRVAIPEGAEVSLETVRASRRLLKGLRLGPDGQAGQGWPDRGAGPTAAPEVGRAEPQGEEAKGRVHPSDPSGDWVDQPVRLGQVGYLRFQRFAEILYAPATPVDQGMASDPAGETVDLAFYPDVEVLLTVDGVDATALAAAAAQPAPVVPLGDDPHFEDSYRAAFVNYEEGRTFRRPQTGAPERFSELTAASAAPSAGPASFASAVTPVYRVFVKTGGIYRLTWSYLLASGTGVAPGLAGTSPALFKLTNKGVEVPIRIVGGGDNSFDPGDYIEFYGEGLLSEPELILNQPFSPADIMQANDFTDENVYYLFGETGTRSRIPNLTGTFAGGTAESAFLDTVRNEFDTAFVPDGVNDPFYQSPVLSSTANAFNPDPNAVNCGYSNTQGAHKLPNFMGPGNDPNFISVACAACLLSLPAGDPNSSSFTATVRARMRGSSVETANPDHMTVVQVGTASPATRSTTMCWDGEAVAVQSVSVPQSVVAAAGAGVYIGQPGLTTTSSFEAFFLDWIEVDYRRALRLSGASLAAHFPNAARNYDMSGFPTNVSTDIIAYDISRAVGVTSVPSPRLVTGGTVQSDGQGGFSLKFTLPLDTGLAGGAQQRFAAAGAGGFGTPLRVTEVIGEDLTAATNEADMIVITTPTVVGTPAAQAFTDYLAHREAASGLSVKVVMMRDVYDQFSDGLETPEAIRSFVRHAVNTWRGPLGVSAAPSYVMLVGDSSLDYKNLTAQSAWVNEVPTFVMYWPGPFLDYYASDTYLAAILGSDQLPDIHLGRISVRNPAETAAVFQKLRNYDQTPPSGAWRSKGLFLTDRGNPGTGEAQEFEAFQNSVADTHFVAPFSNQKLYYNQPPYNGQSANVPAWRAAYVSAADAGAAVTSYTGHGSFDIWGLDGLFDSSFIPLLSPTGKPTFLVNEDCLVGGFHSRAFDSLAENFMKAAGKGTVAVFAPAGLSFTTVFGPINDTLYGEMFGLTKERRFGNLMTDVKLALSFSIPDLQAYVLLGDPAQRLILPAPRPPSPFSAASGQDAKVTLSWTASPDPGVLTRIYRREPFDGGYSLLTPAGVPGTSYVDLAVVNGRPYFYRAVSVDPNGPFEGGVTNLGSTCNFATPPLSGADCVWAMPQNPNPPATPAGFRVSNPGTGSELSVSWSSIGEPDLMHYTVHYGEVNGGPYPNTTIIPAPASGGEVGGLTAGKPYYMIVTATNTSNRTSAPTLQGSGIPSIFEGIAPPEFISDLLVLRSPSFPDSIELRWTPPPTDINGEPTALQSFSIYRATNPVFVPDPNNRIAVISNPSVGFYTDPGAFVAPPNYYYLITATDTDGFTSGASLQLPQGVSDLTLRIIGSNLNLTWSPVTSDIDGVPTRIDHYALYSDPQPVSRERVESLAPSVPFITTVPLTIPMPGSPLVYYSLIVVDVRQNKSPF